MKSIALAYRSMLPLLGHNPSAIMLAVTLTLILLNVAIHLLVALTIRTEVELDELYNAYAMIPFGVSEGQDLKTLVTPISPYGHWLHLAGDKLLL